eukprot:gene18494-22071_t
MAEAVEMAGMVKVVAVGEKKGGTRAGTRMSGEEARAVTTGMVEETGKGIVVAGSMALA